MASTFKIRRQRPVKGGRVPLHPCVLRDIQAEVEKLALRFRCSKSFVVSTALAETFGIQVDELYYSKVPKAGIRKAG